MAKVLVFFADGCEEIEGLTVVDLLRRAGIDTCMVSITDERMVTGSHGIRFETDEILDNADFDGADFMVLPGGMPGTKNLEACSPLMERLDSFHDRIAKGEDIYIAAICAAPSIFAHRGYLKGLKACSNPGFESHLVEGGADLTDGPATLDAHIITSRAMGTAIDFGLKIIEVIKGKAEADELGKNILHPF